MTDTSTAHQCAATTKNGQPCQAYAVAGSSFCFTHDPARAAERAQSRQNGGKARHGRTIHPNTGEDAPLHLDSMTDAIRLIERAVQDALRLERSLNRSRVLISAALAYGRLFETSELAERLEALEVQLAALQGRGTHEQLSDTD